MKTYMVKNTKKKDSLKSLKRVKTIQVSEWRKKEEGEKMQEKVDHSAGTVEYTDCTSTED